MDILKEVLDSMPNSKELELDDVLKNIPSDGSELFDLHKQTYSLNPQQEAEYLKLAQRMEIPKQAVVNNYDAIKAEIETPDESFWQEYERKHPKSAEFFKNSENHSIFRDKFEALADIEKATQENSLVKDVLKSFAAGSASLSAGMWRSGELINDTMEELGPMASKLSFLDSKQMKVLTGFMKVLGNKEAERAKELTPESYTGDVVGELGKGNIKEGSKQLTLALANNAPQMIGMLMGGASGYGVAASMASGLSQAGNTYTESEDSKASRGNKIVHAWGTAAVEAATEQLGTLSVFGSKSFDPLLAAMGKESRKKIIYEGLKGIGKEGFSEGIEELVSELYQTSSSWALNIEDNAFDGFANRAANSFTIGFASGASMRSPVALMESRGRYLDLKDHEGNINTLQKIMNTVKDSELNTRSADSIESFVKTAINENAKDISKIYVDSDVLNQYFQKNPDIDQDAILKELGIDEQVAEANVYGGDIEINTEKLARVAETGIFEQLKEDIKTKPDKLSSNQNRELEEVINGRINEASDAVNLEYERLTKLETDFNLVEEEIYKKLTETGQKNEIAKANAKVFATEIATMARVDNKDLLEFYNEVAPQIVFGDNNLEDSRKVNFSTGRLLENEVITENNERFYQIQNAEEQEILDREIDAMIEEVAKGEVSTTLLRENGDATGKVTGRTYENTYPEYYREIGAKNKADFEKIAKSKKGKRYERIKKAAIDRLVNGWRNQSIGYDMPNNTFREARGLDLSLDPGAVVKGKIIKLNSQEGMLELSDGRTVYFDRSVAKRDINLGDEVSVEIDNNTDFLEANSLFQFAGPKSKSSDMGKLNEARLLELDNVGMDEIRKKTGWFKAPDNKWRYEISDADAKFKDINLNKKKKYKLFDVIDHKELFEAYPDLKDMQVEFAAFRGRKGGHFDRKTKTLKIMIKQDEKYPSSYKQSVERLKVMKEMPEYAEIMGAKLVRDYDKYRSLLNDTEFGRELQIHNSEVILTKPEKSYPRDINADKDAMDTVLHEVQHAIQNIEGFARGGNKLQDGGYQNYLNLHGEQESRDTEKRKNLSDKERSETAPALMEEKNSNKAIIKWDGVEIEQDLPPIEDIKKEFKVNENGQLSFFQGVNTSNKARGELAIKKAEENGFRFELIDNYGDYGVAVYDQNNKVVGSVILRPSDNNTIKTHPYEQVKVDKDQRRKGLASAMYAFAERELGMTMIPSETQNENGKGLWSNPNRPFGPVSLSQNESDPQGRFDVYKDGQTIIRLFKSANASTFLHETGHFWLNHIHSRVVSGTANEAQLKMWNTVSNYLGIPEGSNEITVEQHEKFARVREQYFREGNTPIKGLKNVFRKFSNWLKAIYKTAQELDVEITPEIREFMDSMLQSEVLVAQAKADAGLDIGSLSKLNPEELTPEIRLKIDQLEERAKEIAEEKLVRKQLKAMSADRKKAISDAVENKRKEITEEVNNSDYALFLNEVSEGLNVKDIRSHAQKLVDGQLSEAQETLFEMIAEQEGLSSASHLAQEILKGAPIKEIINQEVNKFKAELEADGSNVALATEARRIVRSEQQVEIKAIESEVLFEMINDRTEAELDRIERELEAGNDKLLLQWVEDQAKHETETKLKGKFEANLEKVEAKGEAKLQKQQQRSDAKIQKLNEDYERLKERSAYKLKEQKTREIWKRAVEAKTKEDKLRIFKEGREQLKKDITDLAKLESITVQSAARNKIAKMAIGDINSQKYFIAHRNAALKTQTALRNGDIKKAYEFKRQEMLNLALAKEAVRVKREADKIKNQLFKERKAKVESYKHEDHFHQVASILGRFGFAKTNYNRPANTMTLAQWKAQYDGQLDLYSMPQTIMNESITKSQDSLTIEDLRDIKNAIKNIRELANSKDRVLSLTSGLTLEGIKQELKDAGRKSTKKKKIVRRGDSKADKALNALDKYFSSLTKIDTYLQALDGFKDGPWQKYFKGIIDKAQDAESREKGILLTNIQKLYSIYDKKELKELSKKKFINELGNTFMKSELIAMALNLGNVSNKEKLLGKPPVGVDSSNWNEQVLMSVLQNELTEKDWKFVQDSWDLVNSYWPRVADLHRDVTGFTPEKIEATPFQVVSNGKVIDLRGGYYPLKKDSRESQVANEQEISTELRQEMPTYAAKTKQGHLEARVDAEYSVSLSLNVMNRHLLNVVHDLTHRKAVIDLRKILNDKEIEQVLRDKIGVEGVNEIHKWLKVVANNSSVDNPIDSFYEKAFQFIRKRTGAVMLLWRFGVLAQNSANMFLFSGGVDGFSNKDALSAVAKYGLASYYPAIANPKKRQEIEAFVFSKSAFMKDKAETPEFTIAELTNKAIGLEEGSKIMELGGNMMAFTDQLINIPVWLGAYHKGLSEGKTEEQAIRQADLLIERSTGSGRKVDQASIMRGNEIDKLFSMFYSFLSVEYNRWSVEAQKAGHNGQAMDFAKFAGFATQRLLVFNIISLVLSGKLFGLEDEEEMAKTVLANTLLYPVSFFPIVRDVASPAINMLLGIDTFGYRPSAAFASVEQLIKTIATFDSYLEGTKDEKELAESFTKAGAYIFGYPDAFNANAWNAYDIMFEGMTPQVTDIYRRRPKKERK